MPAISEDLRVKPYSISGTGTEFSVIESAETAVTANVSAAGNKSVSVCAERIE